MIPYIGDISKADAEVLADLAEGADHILEFGCGASTQVIAKYTDGQFLSIDTDLLWIEKTKRNLDILNIENKVEFDTYTHFMESAHIWKSKLDFIFVDGVDALRREFAMIVWPLLEVEGIIAFHDTRRGYDFRNVLELLATYQNEIDSVVFNAGGSNITLISKKPPEPYDNWQISENRQPWQLGYGDIPAEELAKIKEQVSNQ